MSQSKQLSRIKGSYHLTNAGYEQDEIRSLILRRRLQILVHSCIYYRLGESLVPDSTWDSWAKELCKLQKEYPEISERVDYHQSFKDFNFSTGFDLPVGNLEILGKAQQLLNYHNSKGGIKLDGKANGRTKTIRLDLSGVGQQNPESIHFRVHKGSLILC